jgi:hypothetical protein
MAFNFILTENQKKSLKFWKNLFKILPISDFFCEILRTHGSESEYGWVFWQKMTHGLIFLRKGPTVTSICLFGIE